MRLYSTTPVADDSDDDDDAYNTVKSEAAMKNGKTLMRSL
jgi:hypothetical protein